MLISGEALATDPILVENSVQKTISSGQFKYTMSELYMASVMDTLSPKKAKQQTSVYLSAKVNTMEANAVGSLLIYDSMGGHALQPARVRRRLQPSALRFQVKPLAHEARRIFREEPDPASQGIATEND